MHTPPEYWSLTWPVLKFRYRYILKLFRAELTAYGVRGNTNGPILAAIMVALSIHLVVIRAVAGMRVCRTQAWPIIAADLVHVFLNTSLDSCSSPQSRVRLV